MIKGQYYDWLSSFANLSAHSLLLKKLYLTPFEWIIPFDANRADDGIDLRYRFGREHGISDAIIATELDDCPCSILELIVALALRIEEQIMGDESMGNQTSAYIQLMLSSLGLMCYTNRAYSEREIDDILDRFVNRQYTRTGRGGLFEIPDLDYSRDMRNAEIWYQMCWYLNES